jgi:hypothetical protein
MDPFREEREEVRIQAVGLRQLPGGPGKVAHLARIRDHHGSAVAATAATTAVSQPPVTVGHIELPSADERTAE